MQKPTLGWFAQRLLRPDLQFQTARQMQSSLLPGKFQAVVQPTGNQVGELDQKLCRNQRCHFVLIGLFPQTVRIRLFRLRLPKARLSSAVQLKSQQLGNAKWR